MRLAIALCLVGLAAGTVLFEEKFNGANSRRSESSLNDLLEVTPPPTVASYFGPRLR